MEAAGPIAVGDILEGKYLVEGELGEGAMGVVYAGRHQLLNKRVAIKTLRAEIAREAEIVGRFEQEARAASAIGHPNIVQVFDLGTAPGGVRFMVMEHLDGRSLGDLLAERPLLEPERAVAIIRQVLSALGAAHRRGIVHRDLKPENIYLAKSEENPEFVKLLDFGISKVLEIADPNIAGADSAARATRMGTVLGTPLYMSPEQARGDTDIDHRVDIWAVGCVLYEMLCGRTPYGGENYNQILLAILSGDYPRPSQIRPAITPALEAVIARAMSQERDARFGNTVEMRAALDAAFGGRLPGLATPPSGMPVAAVAEAEALELDDVDGAPSAATRLADSQTGLAAAAGGGKQNDAAMLDALNRIVVGPREEASSDGKMLAPVATDAPSRPAAVASVAEPEAAPAPVEEAPAGEGGGEEGDLFAPPEAQSDDLALALDVGGADRPPPAERVSAEPGAPKSRTTRTEVRARAPRGGLGSAIKWLFLLALLAAGGVAGYRYAVHGYVLEPPKATTVRFELRVSPADGAITVDGKPTPAGAFTAEIGKEYTVEFRAKGRMSAKRHLVAEAGKPVSLEVHLPHLLPTLDARSVSRSRAANAGTKYQPSAPDLDAAFAKLTELRECLVPLVSPLEEGRAEYAKTAAHQNRIGRRHIPKVTTFPEEAITTCRMVLRSSADIDPAMPRVDSMAEELMRGLDELVETTRRLAKYYGDGEYKVDKFALGKRLHGPLVEEYAKVGAGHGELLAEVNARLSRLYMLELDELAKRDGKGVQWHLRSAVLAAHAWLSSEAGHAPRAERRAKREELLHALDAAAASMKTPGKGTKDVEEARACYNALLAVGEIARAADSEKLDLEAALERHNESVRLFDSMIL